MSGFSFFMSSASVPGDGVLPQTFSIIAETSTDVWTKPPSTERFNAPILYRSLPLKSFQRAKVTITPNLQSQYDQGGLILLVNTSDGSRKWVKAGIELVNGKRHLSVVSMDRGADWSLLPLRPGFNDATLEMARESDNTLWIYVIEERQRIALREVTWILEEPDAKDCWVGLYAARPTDKGEKLSVTFSDLVIKTI